MFAIIKNNCPLLLQQASFFKVLKVYLYLFLLKCTLYTIIYPLWRKVTLHKCLQIVINQEMNDFYFTVVKINQQCSRMLTGISFMKILFKKN